MLRRTRIARLDRAAVTRKLTATLLMLALVSAFAPFASALSHAKMPCCEMAAHHEEGGAECVGHSCHTKPATPKKAAKKAEKKETEPSDPMCGTEQAAATTTHAKPQHAAHHAKHTQHAAPSATRQDADDVSSHPPASQDAAQDSSEASAAHTSSSHSHDATAPAIAAAVSKPCPPDCSTGAGSVTNRTSRREHAAHASAHTPRATLPRVFTQRASRPSDLSAEKRRQTRPRAPPSALVS